MSRTLNAHVSLWAANGDLVALTPGDALPEWAVGRVGEHCLMPEAEPAQDADTDDDAGPTPKSKPVTPKDSTPDFTGPAPRRGRPRK